MKSVGEVMAIGRTFKESLQKAIRSMEIDQFGFSSKMGWTSACRRRSIGKKRQSRSARPCAPHCRIGSGGWPTACVSACRIRELFALTKIDPWFLEQIREIVDFEPKIVAERGMIGTGRTATGTLLEAKTIGLCG